MNPIVWAGLNGVALNPFLYPNPGGGAASAEQTLVGPVSGLSINWKYGVDEDYVPGTTPRAFHLFLHGQASSYSAFFTGVWPQILTAFSDFESNPATGMAGSIWASISVTDCWYTDNAAADIGFDQPGAYPIETWIIEDFIPHCREHFTLNDVIFIHGFSMGGFGAAGIGLNHREQLPGGIFRGSSLWQPPRVNRVVANWPVNFPTEYASIWGSSLAKIDLHSWQQICDVNRAAIIADAYPQYCMMGSGDPGLLAFQNAITAVQGFGITLTTATAITASHNLAQMADDGFAPLAIWLQQRSTP